MTEPAARTHRVMAFNTAANSENRMHADDVASQYGFRGGLVPGVDVYAYMTHPIVAAWGADWLTGGWISVRLLKPVYDGAEAIVTTAPNGADAFEITVESGGLVCASGRAERRAPASSAVRTDMLPAAPLPGERPPASPETLVPGTILGTVGERFAGHGADDYLANVRDPSKLYLAERIAHPGWLLKPANTILRDNVRLGPWIHVGSEIRYLDRVHDGEMLSIRGRVDATYEKRGHRFTELDVLVLAGDDRPVVAVRHTAIYEPRRQAA